MQADELKTALAAEPFRACRLHISSGRIIPISNPELVAVSQTGRTAFAHRRASDAFYVIDLRMVESLEFQDQAGRTRKRSA